MLNYLKSQIRRIVFRIFKPPVVYIKDTFSQAGEDRIIKFLFDDKKVQCPSYLDIGTNEPDTINNTYLFYLTGSIGVCIEADVTLIKKIKEVRPKDKILNIGVGSKEEKEMDFYIFDHSPLNTFDRSEALSRQNHGTYKIVNVAKVNIESINKIIRDNFEMYPDFLSIDIEGLDLETLKTVNFNDYPIPVICVETCGYSENHIRPKNDQIIQFMLSKDYFVYGDTYINTIFVNRIWFYRQ
jgi:FkbM family methyltransferase